MIKSEPYGGGVRWHCTECDTNISVPGSTLKHIRWTNGKPPRYCPRCHTERTEYKIKLELSMLMDESNSAVVRDEIDARGDALAEAIMVALGAVDGELLGHSVSKRR